MILIKNRNGFTLIETLLALSLFAVCSVPLFRLQNQLLFGTALYSRQLYTIMLMKNYRYAMRQEVQEAIQSGQELTQFKREKKDASLNNLVLEYTIEPVSKRSSIKLPALYWERVTARWQYSGRQMQETLTMVMFKAPQPEAKKR